MQIALLSLHIIIVFQMAELHLRTFYCNEQETKVFIYLNDDLKTQVKFGTSSGHKIFSDLQWFILLTFKTNISKNELNELGDPRHTLSMDCGRYIRITSQNTQLYLSKNDWSQVVPGGVWPTLLKRIGFLLDFLLPSLGRFSPTVW